MSKMRVATIVGTRPEIIRLSRVIAAMDETFEHVLIHTGQNYDYELNQIFFDDLGLRKPDHFLNAVGVGLAETIGNIISRADKVLEQIAPEALLVLGDTNSCLAVIPAKRRKIPIFHMEAGNRCFDQRVPEESNRKIVDHLSDINMPYSHHARENLLREGLPTDRIIRTGSPMFEVLHHYLPQIALSTVLQRFGLTRSEYYVVSCHREENVDSDSNLAEFVNTLNELAKSRGRRIIVSTHPRTKLRLDGLGAPLDPLVELMKPLGFHDYVHLQMNAAAVLSDSGTITEESSILDFPALNIREAHERPEGMEEGAVMMTGLTWRSVEQGLAILERSKAKVQNGERASRIVADYEAPNLSQKIVKVIQSYTEYVNKNVWRKHSTP